MPSSRARTALVTGGNRGIGFEACRELAEAGLRVVLTARDPGRGIRATEQLRSSGVDVRFEMLDVTSAESVVACAERLAADGVAIDVLVNNAAVYPTDRFLATSEETMRDPA